MNRTLRRLDLSENRVGADGAAELFAALAANRTLATLLLRANDVQGGVASLESLRENSALTDIDVGHNGIRGEQVELMCGALAVNKTLRKLNLQHNTLQARGAVLIAVALTANSALATVNLRGNALGAEGSAALAEALKVNSSLKELVLSETDGIIETRCKHRDSKTLSLLPGL